MKRVILSAAMAWLLWASASVGLAQTKKVTRKVGPPLIGTVTQTGDVYEVVTRIGKIVVPVDQVVSITDHVTFEEDYSRRVLALEPNDAEGHYTLAQWCMGQNKPKHARDELQMVLKLKPDHPNARLLLALVDEELAKARRPRPGGPKGPRMIPGTKIPITDMVSKEDILRIRLAELRSRDRVTIAFRDRADVRFADQMKGVGQFADPNYRRIYLSKRAVARAVEILVELPDATELHRDILVRTNPKFMATFRSRIWPMVAKNCATAKCHGGVKGKGRLRLYNVPTKTEEVFFTNFLILHAFETSDGRMIDRAFPTRSLLLQYGLPADQARVTHDGKDIRAMFRGVGDPRYRFVESWIKEDLIRPRPTYDITFKIPGRRAKPVLQPTGSGIQPTPPVQPGQSAQPTRPLGGGTGNGP